MTNDKSRGASRLTLFVIGHLSLIIAISLRAWLPCCSFFLARNAQVPPLRLCRRPVSRIDKLDSGNQGPCGYANNESCEDVCDIVVAAVHGGDEDPENQRRHAPREPAREAPGCEPGDQCAHHVSAGNCPAVDSPEPLHQ